MESYEQLKVLTVPVYLSGDDQLQYTARNYGPGVVYYGSKTVTSASYDGSIAVDEAVVVPSGCYFVSSAKSKVTVREEVTDEAVDVLELARTYLTAKATGAPQVQLPDGGWTFFGGRTTVAYEGTYRREYTTFIQSDGDVGVHQKDLDTLQEKTVILREALHVDDHSNPTIVFWPEGTPLAGKATVFYCRHAGPDMYYRTMANAEDITSFGEERTDIPVTVGTHGHTYPDAHIVPQENYRIYLVERGAQFLPRIMWSDDFMETWETPVDLFESTKVPGERPYFQTCLGGDGAIHFLMTDGHPDVIDDNAVYHMYYRLGSLYKSDGTFISTIEDVAAGTPLDETQVTELYDGAEGPAWVWSIEEDPRGRLAATWGVEFDPGDTRYYYAERVAGVFTPFEVMESIANIFSIGEESRYWPGIVIDPQNVERIAYGRPARNWKLQENLNVFNPELEQGANPDGANLAVNPAFAASMDSWDHSTDAAVTDLGSARTTLPAGADLGRPTGIASGAACWLEWFQTDVNPASRAGGLVNTFADAKMAVVSASTTYSVIVDYWNEVIPGDSRFRSTVTYSNAAAATLGTATQLTDSYLGWMRDVQVVTTPVACTRLRVKAELFTDSDGEIYKSRIARVRIVAGDVTTDGWDFQVSQKSPTQLYSTPQPLPVAADTGLPDGITSQQIAQRIHFTKDNTATARSVGLIQTLDADEMVPVQELQTYTIAVDIFITAKPTIGRFRVPVAFTNQALATLGDAPEAPNPQWPLGWSRYTEAVTTPADCDRLRLKPEYYTDTALGVFDAWIARVQVIEGDASAQQEIEFAQSKDGFETKLTYPVTQRTSFKQFRPSYTYNWIPGASELHWVATGPDGFYTNYEIFSTQVRVKY